MAKDIKFETVKEIGILLESVREWFKAFLMQKSGKKIN